MTKDERDATVARLQPVLRRLFRTLAEHGPLTPPDLFRSYDLAGGGRWKGRQNGARRELKVLARMGLIRDVGKRGTATSYEVTPADQVEAQMRKAKGRPRGQRVPVNGASRNGTMSEAERIAEYRREEKALGPVARATWLEKRRRFVELTREAKRVERMAFWKAVRDDELEQVYDEVVSLRASLEHLEAAVDMQRANASLREKIANLRNPNGRTLEEAEAFRRKADQLEEGLIG